jgi:F-type H+-transporting ATPase subunit gamma
MGEMMAALAAAEAKNPSAPPLLVGTGRTQTHLLVAITADRGLAGAFNANIIRSVRNQVRELESQGKTVKIFALGRKGNDALRRDLRDKIVGSKTFFGKKTLEFTDAEAVAQELMTLFRDDQFDVCTLVYNRFHSVMSQTATTAPLIPAAPSTANDNMADKAEGYEVEPDDGTLLDRLLPRNLAVQIYAALLENNAGFYASQMTAMDSATRNAGEMIKKLSLSYNRARQANITKELIEIISGAEAV